MTLKLYDTMAREKRDFVPADPSRVTMYVCGPTVYNHAHIGNFRPVVVFDVLFRLLRHVYGEDAVVYARNVTDVDDKINAKATAEGVAIKVVTDRYLAAYHQDADALLALRPTLEPKATEHMGPIVEMIGKLVDNGKAYAAAIPTARYQPLEQTGHLPQIEAPAATLAAVWDFADEHASPPIH
jgi:cysteinyl-tRNA synthetase